MIGAAMWLQDLLAVASGSLVGFVLGLIGGGGSILAVPLLVYVVGVRSPHIAIGTSAIAVSFSALSSLLGHWRAGNVRWPCALVFTVAGVAGAAGGSTLGKAVEQTGYLSGDSFGLADMYAMPIISQSRVTPEGKEAMASAPSLLAYYEKHKVRPSFADTAPPRGK